MLKKFRLSGLTRTPVLLVLLLAFLLFYFYVTNTYINPHDNIRSDFITDNNGPYAWVDGHATETLNVSAVAQEAGTFPIKLTACVSELLQGGQPAELNKYEVTLDCLRRLDINRTKTDHVAFSDQTDSDLINYLTKIIESQNQRIESFESKLKKLETQLSGVSSKQSKPIGGALDGPTTIDKFLTEPVINEYKFAYKHNLVHWSMCKKGSTDVLFIVFSTAVEFKERGKARQSERAKYVNNTKNKARMIFFIGSPTTPKDASLYQRGIDDEAKTYGDIVQVSVKDVYTNIRYKAVAMLSWAITYCPEVTFIIRTDADIDVNPEKAVAAVKRAHVEHPEFILGIEKRFKVSRSKTNKYYVSMEEYPYSYWPPFLLGGLLGYPMSTAKLLYQAALRVKPVWLDDVYLTGMCAPKVGVPRLSDKDFSFPNDVHTNVGT